MSKTTLETLQAARKLIADERDWYQAPIECSLGTKRSGDRVIRCIGAAICAAGAPFPSSPEVWKAMYAATGTEKLYEFNFRHTHAEVLSAFDAAIAKAEASHV